MDLIKLIDQNVECVATPNGRYLKRSEVFEVVEKFTSTNSDYTAALRVWREEWLPLVAAGNHIWNFDWYCEQRLNSEEPNCA